MWRSALMVFLIGFGVPLAASPCINAAHRAAQTHGIPPDVMIALTLVETGRLHQGGLTPWPWATNVSGQGEWHESRHAARAHIERTLARGQRNVDIGCFQINHRWHRDAFASLEEMLSPETNADYAARYLRSHYVTAGDWNAAAALYHSRTPTHQARYRAKFEAIRADLPTFQSTQTAALAGQTGAATGGALFAPARPLLRNARPLIGFHR